MCDNVRVGECKLFDAFKALGKVPLDHSNVPSLGQNFEELLIWEEVEPREAGSLRVEVVVKALYNLLCTLKAVGEIFFQFLFFASFGNRGVLCGFLHQGVPDAVDTVEFLGIVLPLVLDILRAEDREEVHPVLLYLQPKLDNILNFD